MNSPMVIYRSEGGQVDAECEARSEELGAAEEHGNSEEQHHLELAAAIVAWGEEREVTNALPWNSLICLITTW